jgi:hypothetical protein
MKTHELAKGLKILAEILEKGENIQLESASIASSRLNRLDSGQIAVSLATLSDLSRVDKKQWTLFINDLDFPIEIRPRDASRDILGKLLNYLETNEKAREQLKNKATKVSEASPELMRALSSLLKEKS